MQTARILVSGVSWKRGDVHPIPPPPISITMTILKNKEIYTIPPQKKDCHGPTASFTQLFVIIGSVATELIVFRLIQLNAYSTMGSQYFLILQIIFNSLKLCNEHIICEIENYLKFFHTFCFAEVLPFFLYFFSSGEWWC